MKTFHSFIGNTLQPNVIETIQKHRSSIETNQLKQNENDKENNNNNNNFKQFEFMRNESENENENQNEYFITEFGRIQLKEKNAYHRAQNALDRQKYRQKDEMMKQKVNEILLSRKQSNINRSVKHQLERKEMKRNYLLEKKNEFKGDSQTNTKPKMKLNININMKDVNSPLLTPETSPRMNSNNCNNSNQSTPREINHQKTEQLKSLSSLLLNSNERNGTVVLSNENNQNENNSIQTNRNKTNKLSTNHINHNHIRRESKQLNSEKTKRLSNLIQTTQREVTNGQIKPNAEIQRRVSNTLNIKVKEGNEYRKKQEEEQIISPYFQRAPSILRSGLRKSVISEHQVITKRITESINKSQETEKLNESKEINELNQQEQNEKEIKEKEQLVRRVTTEISKSSIKLRKTQKIQLPNRLFIISQVGTEKQIVAVEVSPQFDNLQSQNGALLIDDNNKKLFVWRGKNIGVLTKSYCADFSMEFKAFDKPSYSLCIEDEENESDEFLQSFGISKQNSSNRNNSNEKETKDILQLKLERWVYENKQIKRIPVNENILNQKSLINLHNFYISTSYQSFVWFGKKTSKNSREECVKLAKSIQESEQNNSIKKQKEIIIINGEEETMLFKKLFVDWVDPIIQISPAQQKELNGNKNQKDQKDKNPNELPPFNVNNLFDEPKYIEKRIPDFSDKGTFTKYKVESTELKQLSDDQKYILQSNECYVFHYIYPYKNSFRHTLFFWLGRQASTLIRGKAAALTVDFVEKKRLDANQMRVLEGIEQREFIEMFQGGIVIQRELKKDVKKEFGGGNINVKSITKGNGFNQQNKLNGCNDSKTMNRKIGFNQNTSNTTKQMEKKDSNEPYQIYEIRQQRGTENIRMLQISVEDEVDINRSYFILTTQSDDINQSKGILILGKHSIPLSTIQETLKRCQLISNENLQIIPIDEFLTSFDINNQFNQFTTIKTIPLPQYPHAFKISASTGQIEYEMIYELHIQTLQDNRIVVTIVNSDLFFWVKEDVRLDEIVKLLKTMTDYVECSKIRNVELSPFFIRPLSEPRNFLSVFFGNCELPKTNEKSD